MANITGRTHTITGLSVATSYNFEVLAINEQGIAPNNHAAQLTAATASGGMYSTQMEVSVSVSGISNWNPSSAISCSAQPPNSEGGPPQVLQHLPSVERPKALCRCHHWCADPLPDRLHPTEHLRAEQWSSSILCLWHQGQHRKDTQHQPAG